MFGLGGGKKYQDNVWRLIHEIDAGPYLPSMAPLNSEITKFRLNKFSEHEAALLLCYSSALSIHSAGNHEKAQKLYDIARDAQDIWVKAQLVNANEAHGFNTHIAEISGIRTR